ncbi:MAG: phosphatidate cytidylyltransferase, partial [Treponema sp.]|nr:phosphatidate cytidylyltransferase [Treponema sp.]
MKTTIKRLLIFFVSLPLVIGIVVLLPYKNQLAVNILIILLSALGAVEFADLLRKKNIFLSSPEAAALGASCPLAMTLTVSFGVYNEIILAVFVLGASWLFISGIFTLKKTFEDFAGRLAAG